MKNTIFIILVIGLITLSACTFTTDSNNQENTINVQGNSELRFQPDEAEVSIGVSILKPTAKEAQDEVNKVINQIIDNLRYKGFDEKDIQTEQISLYEDYSWSEDGRESLGWRATQNLLVKSDDITKVGDIIDAATEGGANQINNINFGLSEAKEQEYKAQALSEATKSAKDKAEIIANSLNVKLHELRSVTESNYYYVPYRYDMAMGVEKAADEAATILPQEVTITAQVALIYTTK
ncbi:SIMPL domain-containing protein [Candidatus Woesearchaeota archaeon]|nr:SIMPL domain-containing protein [Candidatus Woesearchaeota archaeon]